MKFAIAFVIGNIELHDKLCGQYGVRNDKVKRLCRHYKCIGGYGQSAPLTCRQSCIHGKRGDPQTPLLTE